MKHRYWLIPAIILALLAGACGRSSTYRDGIYTAAAEEYEGGWMDIVSVTVSEGKISDVDWDSLREEDGASKKELSESGEYDMMAAGAAAPWHEQAGNMEEALVERQAPSKIKVDSDGKPDGISGVTIKVNQFRELAEDALEQAR